MSNQKETNSVKKYPHLTLPSKKRKIEEIDQGDEEQHQKNVKWVKKIHKKKDICKRDKNRVESSEPKGEWIDVTVLQKEKTEEYDKSDPFIDDDDDDDEHEIQMKSEVMLEKLEDLFYNREKEVIVDRREDQRKQSKFFNDIRTIIGKHVNDINTILKSSQKTIAQ